MTHQRPHQHRLALEHRFEGGKAIGLESRPGRDEVADEGRDAEPRGQLDGAIAMGFGWALYEKMVYDDNGTMVNPALRDYRIPAFADVPRSELRLPETPFEVIVADDGASQRGR